MMDTMIREQPQFDIDHMTLAWQEVSALSKPGVFYHIHRDSPTRLSSYFEVDRHPEDDIIHKELGEGHVPWIKHYVKDSELPHVQAAIKRGVALLLARDFPDSFTLPLQKWSKVVDNFRFYDSAITAAATLVYSLCPQYLLYTIGHRWVLQSQMNDLWCQFSEWGKQGLPVCEVYKLIARHKIDKDKYSFVTEPDILSLLHYYVEQYSEDRFLHPYQSAVQQDYDEEEIDTVFQYIKGVVNKMDCSEITEVDDYTRLLIKIYRGDDLTELVTTFGKYEPLFAEVRDSVYTGGFEEIWTPYFSKEGLSLEDIKFFFECALDNLVRTPIIMLERSLIVVQQPLFELCDSKSLELSFDVCEIIQVAELRRVALGSRFISQKHLLWAFHECGYGLPRSLRMVHKFYFNDEEHPPYHVYVACVKLAEYLEEKVVQLHHFVFAILKWRSIGDGELVIEMLEDFKDYMEDLNSTNNTEAEFGPGETHVKEARRRDISCQFEEENKKRRIESSKHE